MEVKDSDPAPMRKTVSAVKGFLVFVLRWPNAED
jgi:hypothetical protein